jgi:hypothetical protein
MATRKPKAAVKPPTPDNYLIEWKQDEDERWWWHVTNEATDEVADKFAAKTHAINRAVELTQGRGAVKVRDPETGQFTDDSR